MVLLNIQSRPTSQDQVKLTSAGVYNKRDLNLTRCKYPAKGNLIFIY